MYPDDKIDLVALQAVLDAGGSISQDDAGSALKELRYLRQFDKAYERLGALQRRVASLELALADQNPEHDVARLKEAVGDRDRKLNQRGRLIAELQEALERRNLQLAAWHHVWCNGGCVGGCGGRGFDPPTREVVDLAVHQVGRLVTWWNNREFAATDKMPIPGAGLEVRTRFVYHARIAAYEKAKAVSAKWGDRLGPRRAWLSLVSDLEATK